MRSPLWLRPASLTTHAEPIGRTWPVFAAWGGSLPAEPALVASYIAAHADTLSVATLVRRIATISKAHEARGLPNPCRSKIVRATLRGVRRTRGTAHREAKPLPAREDLFRVLDAMGDSVKDARCSGERRLSRSPVGQGRLAGHPKLSPNSGRPSVHRCKNCPSQCIAALAAQP